MPAMNGAIYEPQGIFKQGWQVQVREETSSIIREPKKGKRRKSGFLEKPHNNAKSTWNIWIIAKYQNELKSFPCWSALVDGMQFEKKKKCKKCGKEFAPKQKDAKFCSVKCAGAGNSRVKYVSKNKKPCIKCHALVGLNCKQSSNLMNCNRSSIWKHRTSMGLPIDKGASIRKTNLIRRDSQILPWWGNSESAIGWMSHNKAKFPDWGSIAQDHINKKRGREYQSRMHHTKPKDHPYRLKKIVRSRVYNAIKRQIRGVKPRIQYRTTEMIGCSMEYFRRHIELQFKPGMTWENHGSEWHIDHIIPLANFDFTDESQIRTATHYTNMQPLWAGENLAKGDKILKNHQFEINFLQKF
jgi:hypothetical protein